MFCSVILNWYLLFDNLTALAVASRPTCKSQLVYDVLFHVSELNYIPVNTLWLNAQLYTLTWQHVVLKLSLINVVSTPLKNIPVYIKMAPVMIKLFRLGLESLTYLVEEINKVIISKHNNIFISLTHGSFCSAACQNIFFSNLVNTRIYKPLFLLPIYSQESPLWLALPNLLSFGFGFIFLSFVCLFFLRYNKKNDLSQEIVRPSDFHLDSLAK